MTSNIKKTKPHTPNNFNNKIKPITNTHLPKNTKNLKNITLKIYYTTF